MNAGMERAAAFMGAAASRLVASGSATFFSLERRDGRAVVATLERQGPEGKTQAARRAFDEAFFDQARHPVIIARQEFASLLVVAGMGREEAVAFITELDDAGRPARR